jgi:hypothetical protein
MGWQIRNEVNTVAVNRQVALALCRSSAASEYDWEQPDDVIYGARLQFNSDHMEHMDYIGHSEVQDILNHFKVKGDICFSSTNGGMSWGYRFDGKGGVVPLRAVTTWVEVRPEPKKPAKKKSGRPG